MDFAQSLSRVGADPFAIARDERDPVRRLRGKLAAPVTVLSAYDASGAPAGITASSVVVAEGEPAEVLALIDPLCAWWQAAESSGHFALVILAADQAGLSERFALQVPGDPFEGATWAATAWGPVLEGAATWVGCSLVGASTVGYSLLVRGAIGEIVIDDRAIGPLVHFRGSYTTLRSLGEQGSTPG